MSQEFSIGQSPHCNPAWAAAIGMDEAIVLAHVIALGKGENAPDVPTCFHGGHYWASSSSTDWLHIFPDWGHSRIALAFLSLKEQGLLLGRGPCKWVIPVEDQVSKLPIPSEE